MSNSAALDEHERHALMWDYKTALAALPSHTEPTCAECIYGAHGSSASVCRRHAPAGTTPAFPPINSIEWCGELVMFNPAARRQESR